LKALSVLRGAAKALRAREKLQHRRKGCGPMEGEK
jgi:hypothetical protein